jgi:Ni/Co efflux regulator RcnB
MKRAALIGTLVVSLAAGSAAMAGPGGRGHDEHRERPRSHYVERHDVHRGYSVRGGHRAPVRYGYGYGAYYRPRGYYAHRWVRGERLPVSYYARPYVVVDYPVWGLRVPPRGYHWVRVDGDAVLAAVATGIVLDTMFHVFN